MLYDHIDINAAGHLTMAGTDLTDLAREYGTPLYVMDEGRIRQNCRDYTETMREAFGGTSAPLFASKALCTTAVDRVVHSEGMRIDAVSCGEIFTALRAGVPAGEIYFHGNGKTDADIRWAMEQGVGVFVVDNPSELDAVDACAGRMGKKQRILLRLTAGIDPHTFEAVNTGKIDCQFGVPMGTGLADAFTLAAMRKPNVDLLGFHCHIGSMIFAWTPYRDAVNVLLQFMARFRKDYGFETRVLDLGGGFGVRYLEYDPEFDLRRSIQRLGKHLREQCQALELPLPEVLLEPGRSIVADAGLTLYTVSTVKTRPGGRSYVVIDGGMTDNPRYVLYGASYTVLSASRAGETPDFLCTLTGRCCESGDRIQEDIMLPSPARGDLIAVLTTGAYNYSMASNYNRLCRPAMVLLSENGPYLAVRRETIEDLVACDL